jgi:hypothetical protein
MFDTWRRHASPSGRRFPWRARVTLALAAGLGSAVAGCPSDATRCAYLVVNVGTGSGQPPEDGTPVTLQAQGGQRLYITMVGGTFTYGSQQNQTAQCVPAPLDNTPVSFSVTPVPSGEATLRVDLLGQADQCAAEMGGSTTTSSSSSAASSNSSSATSSSSSSCGGTGGAPTSLDVGCPGELLANKIVVFVAPVTTTSSNGGTGGAGSTDGGSGGGGGADGGEGGSNGGSDGGTDGGKGSSSSSSSSGTGESDGG